MPYGFINIMKKIIKRINRKILILKRGYVCDAKIESGVKILKGCLIDKFSKVGKYTFINTNCTVTRAVIGNYCFIGSNVVIGPGEHNLNRISISGHFYADGYEELTQKPVEIGHDVWIGTYAIIMRGVKIGTGAVIGAGSIVTKNVPDYAVVVGSPAKIIKYRFNSEEQKKILQSDWFLYEKNEARGVIINLEDDPKK